ncbi:winged helix-turn-helix transcriptional regulator [Pseudomonas sp. NPDC087358]|uniref:winged helix-turn-helix transcriptional regulator n=1 Tax=Pseudomonas sp. NPDC087358 TaxID=3364439 RepID=UPI00384E3BE3
MKRKCLDEDQCPIARSLDVVGDWWTLLIIRDAVGGATRFGEFQKHLDIAKNILATRLKALVEQRIFTVVSEAEGGHGQYFLTAKGKALLPVLVTLAQWGEEHTVWDAEGTKLLDAKNLQPLRRVELMSQDGRILRPDDVVAIEPA